MSKYYYLCFINLYYLDHERQEELLNQELQDLHIIQQDAVGADNQLDPALINQLIAQADMGPDEAARVSARADYSPLQADYSADKKTVLSENNNIPVMGEVSDNVLGMRQILKQNYK